MKTPITALVITACALWLVANGCSKKESVEAPAAPPPQSASNTVAGAVKKVVDTAQAQTEVVKQKAEEAAVAVQAQATTAQAQADAATSKAQGLIDQAKKYLGENKWSEALALLNQLTGQKLTTEQQSLVQSLKEQAQKASEAAAKAKATDEATKAVGGLLPPKK